MLALKKTDDVLFELGINVKTLRLACNWTRQEFADRCGVPYATLSRLEQTGEGSMRHYVAVMRTLNALEGLEALIKPPPVSPLELMKFKGNVRQRGSGKGRKGLAKRLVNEMSERGAPDGH